MLGLRRYIQLHREEDSTGRKADASASALSALQRGVWKKYISGDQALILYTISKKTCQKPLDRFVCGQSAHK